MKQLFKHPIWRRLASYSDLIMAVMILMVVVLIIVPLPAVLLDLFLTLNIGLAIVILLLAIFSKHVLDFSVFPTLLLVTTLFRLSLNISSTRLILSTGEPGSIVTSFGEFVTKGDMIVGSVIFIIIVIVQFLVITNGSSRVAEVSARFTLDAMPGKQMAIDADLNSGLIDEKMAKKRREEIQIEAEFYGAMDGASKFVKGDAIAGIIIVLINFIGGVLIFSLKGYGAMDALNKFGILTIGDGLVSQIPALLISVAAGIVVTRTPSDQNLGTDLTQQLLSVPKALAVASGVMFVFAIMPGLPFLPFMVLATIVGVAAYLVYETEQEQLKLQPIESQGPMDDLSMEVSPEDMTRFLQIETFEVCMGAGLVSLFEDGRDRDLLNRVQEVRRQIAQELGIIVPSIQVRDNIVLQDLEYNIFIKGQKVGEGELYPNHYMVINPYDSDYELDGIETVDPTFDLPALWIEKRLKPSAEQLGYTIVDAETVFITQIKEVLMYHAHELLGRQELKVILDALKDYQPSVVEDVVPDVVSLGLLMKILKNLLKEEISIRDLSTILETLAEYAKTTNDAEILTGYVRHALGRQIIKSYVNTEGVLDIITLEPNLEKLMGEHLQHSIQGTLLALTPQVTYQLIEGIKEQLDLAMTQQATPVIMVSNKVRYALKKCLETELPRVPVLAFHEVPNGVHINITGTVTI